MRRGGAITAPPLRSLVSVRPVAVSSLLEVVADESLRVTLHLARDHDHRIRVGSGVGEQLVAEEAGNAAVFEEFAQLSNARIVGRCLDDDKTVRREIAVIDIWRFDLARFLLHERDVAIGTELKVLVLKLRFAFRTDAQL